MKKSALKRFYAAAERLDEERRDVILLPNYKGSGKIGVDMKIIISDTERGCHSFARFRSDYFCKLRGPARAVSSYSSCPSAGGNSPNPSL